MNKLSTVDDVLDFAIGGESKASELYTEMAAMVENPWISKTLEGFAQDELRHEKKLKAVRARKLTLNRDQVSDLGIADTLAEGEEQDDGAGAPEDTEHSQGGAKLLAAQVVQELLE